LTGSTSASERANSVSGISDSQYHSYGIHCHAADGDRLAEAAAPRTAPKRGPKPRAQRIEARITDVTDGDTLRVRAFGAKRKRYRVRLIGIDTPETVDPDAPVECGGPEAVDSMIRRSFTDGLESDGDGLLDKPAGQGRRVVLVTDPSRTSLTISDGCWFTSPAPAPISEPDRSPQVGRGLRL
jgi:hypothetical protein